MLVFIILIQFRFYIQLAYGELLKWYPVSAAEDALVCQMISREHFSKLKAFYRSNYRKYLEHDVFNPVASNRIENR